MNDVNHVTITGRLTRDAELKEIKGFALATFSVAVNKAKKINNEWKNEAAFFECSWWGDKAHKHIHLLKKGEPVTIIGALQQDRWQGTDGKNHSIIKINVNSLFVSLQPQQQQNQYNAQPSQLSPQQQGHPLGQGQYNTAPPQQQPQRQQQPGGQAPQGYYQPPPPQEFPENVPF